MNGQTNRDALSRALAELRVDFGERLTTADDERNRHARDASHHPPRAPDAVVFPESTAEVARIAAVCTRHRVPMIPFGTGTAVEGGVLAVAGGVTIDLARMNRILRVSVPDMDATVEAGVTRKQLNRSLLDRHTMLHFPIDPGADASLGGMAATGASGSAAVRYGTMRENVLGLTVVLADGRLVRTGGRARKSSAGYDLTRLFVGSEGTLGIITEVTLRLARLPAAVSAGVCPFDSIGAAVAAVIDVIGAGIPVARIELLDEVLMAAIRRYSGLDHAAVPTLFFEFHGTAAAVQEQAAAAGEILRQRGAGEFRWAAGEVERDRLWQARHDAYYACLALRPDAGGYVTDVCVPISELAGCIRRAKELLKTTRVPAPLFGHVGDGNYHVVFVVEAGDAAELAEVEALSRQIIADALAAGGTSTGEHGIGLGKLEALAREHPEGLDVMRAIKRSLDPYRLMNPGKVVG